MKFGFLGVLAAALAVTLFAFSAGGAVSTAQAADACGNDVIDVPDTGATFDFVAACEVHDVCYGNGGSEADRKACDDQFFADMKASCSAMWPTQFFKRLACNAVAGTYYLGVRLGGWAFFPYS